jgi:ubiquinone/menaquinone biosynthesis C-methylase UbiE
MNYFHLFYWLYERAAKEMCSDCEDFIKPGSKLLDLGCGSGIVGKKFQDYFKSQLIGIDIQNNLIEKIPFQIFDGKNIPFPEKSFDVVLINYVLHHTLNPAVLLKETKRVAKKIIVYEDLPEGFLSKLICRIHGITFANFFQKDKNFGNFQKEKEWEKIFQELGLNIIFKKRVANFPVKKELFILGVPR